MQEIKIEKSEKTSLGIRFSLLLEKDKKEIGHAYLYIMNNDLHEQPFGLIEDVFIDEEYRKQGLGTKLINTIIQTAKERNCYKIIATSRYSRPKVHSFYKKLGFQDYGKEFRIDL